MTEPAGKRQRQRMPRWVVGFIIAGVALVALVVLLLAFGHSPRQHMLPVSPKAWT